MNTSKPLSKLMAMILTVSLLFGTIPLTAVAEVTGCTHEHDADCGYSEAVPCGHVHDENCGELSQNNPTSTPTSAVIVASFDDLDEYTLWQGYDYGEIISQSDLDLPDKLTGTDPDGDSVTIQGVTWQSDPSFDPAVSAWYDFSPVLPGGYILAAGAYAPVISVFIRPEGGMQITAMALNVLGPGWYLVNGALTISNDSGMSDWARNGCRANDQDVRSVVIADGVTSIWQYAFISCINLVSVVIPSTVTSIGDSAFLGCRSLTSVTIPDSVTSIDADAFSNCTRLTSVAIPAGVTFIGTGAFRECKSLAGIFVDPGNLSYASVDGVLFDRSITELIQYPPARPGGSYAIPATVTTIGPNAFNICHNLTNITIPIGVTSIGHHAFSDCDSLTGITIPAGVTSIGDGAFFSCMCLTGVAVDQSNPSYASVDGVLFDKNVTTLLHYPAAKADADYALPDTVTTIVDNAFRVCKNLTGVTIPAGVTDIGDYAFAECHALTSVTFLGGTPPAFGLYVFFEVPGPITINVPPGSESAYNAALQGLLPTPPSPNSTTGRSDSSTSARTVADSAVQSSAVSWLNQNRAAALADSARENGRDYARTSSTGAYGARTAALKALAGLRYMHDTVADGAVQVRLTIDNPEKITNDVMVSGYVKDSNVDRIRSRFERWFKNKVQVIHMDQIDPWGQPVKIAAKVDLTGMDIKSLFFYSYSKNTNTYKRIEKPAHWIDKNGYLHLATEYAGDIIISEGPLEWK